MTIYILRRLALLPVVLLALSLMIFSLQLLLTPTQRLAAYVSGPEALKGGAAEVADLIAKYGLDDPFPVQYGRWLGLVVRGDLGWSETARQPVSDALLSLFPATLELVGFSFILSFLLAIWLGTRAGAHHNRLPDHVIRLATILGWSFPTYVFGLVMLLVFYGALDWFPPGRLSQWALIDVGSAGFTRFTGINTLDALLNGNMAIFWDAVRHLVAPVVTLTFVSIASMTRVMRTSMLESLRQDYVRTARAKGVPRHLVVRKHARRNAMLPVITMAGMELAVMMGGVVITETIFDYHGLGQFAANAAAALDFPAVLGFGMYFALVLVLINLAVDLIYPLLDPRVRLK